MSALPAEVKNVNLKALYISATKSTVAFIISVNRYAADHTITCTVADLGFYKGGSMSRVLKPHPLNYARA